MPLTTIIRDPREPKTLEALSRKAKRGDGNKFHRICFGGTAPIKVYVHASGWVLVAANNQDAYPGVLNDENPVNIGGNSILPARVFSHIPDVRELLLCNEQRSQISITTKFTGDLNNYTGAFSRFTRNLTMAINRSESDLWQFEQGAAGAAAKNISKSISPDRPLKEAIFGGDPTGVGDELNWRPADGTSQVLKGQNIGLQLWMRWIA